MEDHDGPISIPGKHLPLQLLSKDKMSEIGQLRDALLDRMGGSLTKRHERYCTDVTLYRYLRARKFDQKESLKMLLKTLEWRDSFLPDMITVEEVESQVRKGHMFQFSTDNYQRPMMYMKVHKKLDPHTRAQKLKFMVHALERANRSMDESRGVDAMVWVVSCAGYNLKYNGEIGFARELIDIMQNHYPERLGALYVYDAPWIFKGVWKTIRPFLDPKTQSKIRFVNSGTSARGSLEEIMSLDHLLKEFSGESSHLFDADKLVETIKQEENALKESLGGTDGMAKYFGDLLDRKRDQLKVEHKDIAAYKAQLEEQQEAGGWFW